MTARGASAATGEGALARPCPFCGAPARAVPDGSGWRLSVSHDPGCYLAGHVGRWYDALDDLVAEWDGPGAYLPADASLCLVFAERWSMTRRTYAPSVVSDVVARALPRLAPGYARIILDDLAEARDRRDHGWPQPGLAAFDRVSEALEGAARGGGGGSVQPRP